MRPRSSASSIRRAQSSERHSAACPVQDDIGDTTTVDCRGLDQIEPFGAKRPEPLTGPGDDQDMIRTRGAIDSRFSARQAPGVAVPPCRGLDMRQIAGNMRLEHCQGTAGAARDDRLDTFVMIQSRQQAAP